MSDKTYGNVLYGLGMVFLSVLIFGWLALGAVSYNGCQPNNFAGYDNHGAVICVGQQSK